MVPPAALVLLALATAGAGAPAPAPAPAPSSTRATIDVLNWNSTARIRICAANVKPFVNCWDEVAGRALPPQQFSGFEIDLARRVFVMMRWPQAALEWKCMPWRVMLEDLHAGGKECDIAVAGLAVSTRQLEQGVIFSWPTMQSSLGILVPTQRAARGDYFAFVGAFTWQVWVVTILTGIAVGVIVAMLDRAVHSAQRAFKRRLADNGAAAGAAVASAVALEEGEAPRALAGYVWEGVSRPMQMTDFTPVSLPGSLVALVYGFMVLVLVTLYTATTTANITAVVLASTINGLPDLPGKSVVTWVDYIPEVAKYGVSAAGMRWEDGGDAMIDAVRTGAAAALILDRPFLLAKTVDMCEVQVLKDDFAPTNLAIAFPAGFDNAPLLTAVNEALISLRESGDTRLLEEKYFDIPLPACKEPESLAVESSIHFSQVAGLWIVLGVAVLCGAALAAAYAAHLRWSHRHIASAGAAVVRGVCSLGHSASLSGVVCWRFPPRRRSPPPKGP